MQRTTEERLARLEKTNRLLVIACSILIAIPLFAGIMAFQSPDEAVAEVVKAKRFELVEDDKVLAAIMPILGGGRIVLSDADGKPALIATSFGDGGGTLLIAAKEKGGAVLSLSSRVTGAQLQMDDPNHALQLSILETGASFTFASKKGQTGLDFLANEKSATLTVASIKDNSIIELLTSADGPHIDLIKSDKSVFSAPGDSK